MDCSSETESDSGVSVCSLTCADDFNCPHPTLSAFPPPDASLVIPLINLNDVTREIQKLSNEDMDCDFESAPILDELQRSVDILVSFVTHIPDLLGKKDIWSVLVTVAALIDVTFLDKLFLYRKRFRDAAVSIQGVHRATVILTWVDELLARLHSVLLTLASGSYLLDHENSGVAQSIQSQKRDDVLRATTQLPEKWIDIHTVIGSASFSPAAKRIATTLMFAAYVVHPQIMQANIKSFENYSKEYDDIQSSLYFATSHLSTQMQSTSRVVEPFSQRVIAAMLVVLFSTFDCGIAEHTQKNSSPKLRPEGFRHLLYLLQQIMSQPTDSFLPVEHLDLPQIVVLRWGNVVPWTWSTWDDPRIANTEQLPCLTATWLLHLNEPLFTNMDRLSPGGNFRTVLFTDIKASSLMILQLLQNTVRALNDEESTRDTSYSVLLNLLSKLCWAIVRYLESNSLRTIYVIEARIPEYVKLMIVVYNLLGMSSEDLFVKSLITEGLTHVSPESITSCVQNLLKDQTYRFVNQLGKVTRSCIRTLTSRSTTTVLEHGHVLNTKALIEFLTIILSTIKPEETAVQEIASPFIDAVIKGLKSQDDDSLQAAILRNSTLMILCVSQNAQSGQFDDDAWALAVHPGPHSVITAGIFSQYLQAGRLYDPLLCYEAWDYLLSMLIMILSREVLKEEEPLALVTSTLICRGLKNLLHGSRNRQMVLSSPWTVSMEFLLRNLLNNASATVAEPYFVALKKRLACTGESLLSEMSNGSNDIYGTSSVGATETQAFSASIADDFVQGSERSG